VVHLISEPFLVVWHMRHRRNARCTGGFARSPTSRPQHVLPISLQLSHDGRVRMSVHPWHHPLGLKTHASCSMYRPPTTHHPLPHTTFGRARGSHARRSANHHAERRVPTLDTIHSIPLARSCLVNPASELTSGPCGAPLSSETLVPKGVPRRVAARAGWIRRRLLSRG